MEISTQDGDGVSVIEVIKTTERAPTYNLTVADAHTFFVGNDGIWVHNTDCFDQTVTLPNGRQIDASLAPDDLDHVLRGDVNANGSVTGGHSTNSGNVVTVGDVELGNGQVRRAAVEIDGKPKTNTDGGVSTLFPENWPDQRVVEEAAAALGNQNSLFFNQRTGNLTGVSPSGVLIEFRRSGGRIISFFPSELNFKGP